MPQKNIFLRFSLGAHSGDLRKAKVIRFSLAAP